MGLAYSLGPILTYNTQGEPGATISFGGDGTTFARYDTGHIPGGDFDSRVITLDGTPDARRRGQFKLDRFSGNIRTSIQNLTNDTIPQVELYAEGSYFTSLVSEDNDEFFLRNLYMRTAPVNVGSGFHVEAGSLDTLISDYGAVPTTVEGVVPIGSITRGTPTDNEFAIEQLQIRLGYRFDNGIVASVAVQQPTDDDFMVPATDIVLDRAPDVLARLRYKGDNAWPSYRVAGIIRTFAVEDVGNVEHVSNGWGLTGVARFKNTSNTTAVFIGGTSGSGIGSRLFGVDAAAFREGGDIQTFSATGAYIGLAQQWLPESLDQCSLWSNFCYGIARTDLANSLSLNDKNRKVRNAWANLIWQVNANTAIALEYDYGSRETNAGIRGDNHRVQMVIQVGASSVIDTSTTASGFRKNAGAGAPYLQRL